MSPIRVFDLINGAGRSNNLPLVCQVKGGRKETLLPALFRLV